jgi:hypothetical protein
VIDLDVLGFQAKIPTINIRKYQQTISLIELFLGIRKIKKDE